MGAGCSRKEDAAVSGNVVNLLLVSTLCGAAVGIERQWSGHADGAQARFGGLRTFTLLGLLGGFAGVWSHLGAIALSTTLLAGATALVVVAYAVASRRDVDATTEVAALVVLASGVMAGRGDVRLAAGVVALTVLLLVEKSRLHAVVRLLDDQGFRAGVRFAVLALVVLPLLPEGPYGPLGGVRPRVLWLLVLFFSGLSFVGYVARAIVGDRYGYVVTGLLGGLVSSTNVTLTYARLSRSRSDDSLPLAGGVVAACSVLFVRVAVAVAVLEGRLLPTLLPLLVAPLAVGALASWGLVRRTVPGGPMPPAPGNPLELVAALQIAAAFQLVLFVLDVVTRWFGTGGLLGLALLLGLTDVDALTASTTARVGAGLDPALAAMAIGAGILSNTIAKLGIAGIIGRGRFRFWTVAVLAAMAAAGVLSLAASGRAGAVLSEGL
jgi:uncharacterized membrane protein (DUF4010 family)